MNSTEATQPLAHDPLAALRSRDFRLFTLGNGIAIIGFEMQSLAVGWELYERTGSALALGWVGLIQALPIILLSLPAGQIADRFDRKRIVMITQLAMSLLLFGLAAVSWHKASVSFIYAILLFIGIARAFNNPARAALLSQIVPLKDFSNAVTWNSSVWQISSMTGPALAGFIIAAQKSATLIYLLGGLLALTRFIIIASIKVREQERSKEPLSVSTLIAGISFVWRTKLLLGTITLDLFAVLLGGAMSMLPVFAKDILNVGPSGLGWLRAAPSVGAFAMALLLIYMPPLKKAGKTMLWAVAGFGIAMLVFGLSKSFPLSLAMLCLSGALDNISVVVRGTLLQVLTPDAMRGRVSAVNAVFIASSNELGDFESGVVAAFFGPVASVVSGAVGTILVVTVITLLWPEIRRFGALNQAGEH